VFPWGRNRVRAGVGIIHPDSSADPEKYVHNFIATVPALKNAQPVEHHSGLIPSERFAKSFTGDGIIGIGDAAGHASSLLGEGIPWPTHAGRMAGKTAAIALRNQNTSKQALLPFEKQWKKKFGRDLQIAHHINRRISLWDDKKWDERLEI